MLQMLTSMRVRSLFEGCLSGWRLVNIKCLWVKMDRLSCLVHFSVEPLVTIVTNIWPYPEHCGWLLKLCRWENGMVVLMEVGGKWQIFDGRRRSLERWMESSCRSWVSVFGGSEIEICECAVWWMGMERGAGELVEIKSKERWLANFRRKETIRRSWRMRRWYGSGKGLNSGKSERGENKMLLLFVDELNGGSSARVRWWQFTIDSAQALRIVEI